MAAPEKKRQLKGIETCPNGHHYNAARSGEICEVCGAKLDLPEDLPKDALEELVRLDRNDWICGLLVCTKGLSIGREYKIRGGKNYIGSSSVMDIHILGDKKIGKKNHAVIAYDAKERTTLILPGESQGMIYWQGKAIYEPQPLVTGNEIELGESVFRFYAICDSSFNWPESDDSETT